MCVTEDLNVKTYLYILKKKESLAYLLINLQI